jgi:cytochrome c556
VPRSTTTPWHSLSRLRERGIEGGTRSLILAAAALAALAACQSAPPRRSATPQAVAMRQMAADMLAVRAFVNGTLAPEEAVRRAEDLAALAGRTAELFPVEATPRRYPEISPDMARAAPEAMRSSAAALLAAVRGGDRLAISRAITAVEDDGCGACHH